MKKNNAIFVPGAVIHFRKKRRPTTASALRMARTALRTIADNHGGAAVAVRALEATKNPTTVDTAALRRMSYKFTSTDLKGFHESPTVARYGSSHCHNIINQFIDYLKANTK